VEVTGDASFLFFSSIMKPEGDGSTPVTQLAAPIRATQHPWQRQRNLELKMPGRKVAVLVLLADDG
jgi:hypothetical protein